MASWLNQLHLWAQMTRRLAPHAAGFVFCNEATRVFYDYPQKLCINNIRVLFVSDIILTKMQTPLNYTGNKSRLVEDFKRYFPKDPGVFVDLFCGGGAVGLSIDAKKVIFVDNNKKVIELLKHLSAYKFELILGRLEQLIETYNLSYSAKFGYSGFRKGVLKTDNNGLKYFNEKGFYQLRDAYNSFPNKLTIEAQDMLYLLVVYGFNNDMRFNRSGEYNLPVGKTDLNKNNIKKLKGFINRVNNIECEFVCGDFRDDRIRQILFAADFIYADPPYLVGRAVYNENGNWTESEENDLLALFEELHEKDKKIAFSNVLSRVDRENEILQKWQLFRREDFHIFDIKYHYRSSSYNKKNRQANEREVLITNVGNAFNRESALYR